MKLVKTRYEPLIREVRFDTHIYTKAVVNRHGNMQDLNCVIVVPEISSEELRVQLKEEIKDQKKAQKIIDQADEIHSRIVALINDNPQGVVIKLGAGGSHTPPDSLSNYKILNWKDDTKDMGVKIHSDLMAEVKKAVLDRFAKVEVAPSWFKL
jgi:hypothetical protein